MCTRTAPFDAHSSYVCCLLPSLRLVHILARAKLSHSSLQDTVVQSAREMQNDADVYGVDIA